MNSLLKRMSLVAFISFSGLTLLAQNEVPKGWHLMDLNDNGFYGISLDKAYQFVKSKNLKSNPVIVAVIDSGVDTTHEDLKSVLWRNPKEIPGNGIDDDKNGYVDDVYGWNFLGGKDGRNVEKDSYEAARVYHKYRSKWEGKTIDVSKLTKDEKATYEMWKRSEAEMTGGEDKMDAMQMVYMKRAYGVLVSNDSLIQKGMNKVKYTGNELQAYEPSDNSIKKAKLTVLNLFQANDALDASNEELIESFGDYIKSEESKMEAAEKAPIAYRDEIVKDNYDDFNDKFYGNNNVMVSNKAALHGTHVSGIIAAARNNGVGMDGVADNVKIMTIRAVPDGDEHDKDIALAIRYAVDNGAKVVNMSFGKSFSPEKKWVDDAVKYAESKGVLLVHAAGNEAKNLDNSYNFPTGVLLDSSRAANWVTVGASGDPKSGGLAASFSNFGKKEVDVFAPGVKIYATVPGGNTYQNLQGTSMASPVVAGMAAFILEYFPNLSPEQVKSVIEKSVYKPTIKAPKPGTGENVDFSELSISGGVINAYEAIKLASTIKAEKPKSKVNNKPKA